MRWLFSFSFNLLALNSTDINSNNLAREDTGALSSWKAERRRDKYCVRGRGEGGVWIPLVRISVAGVVAALSAGYAGVV